MKRVIRFIFGMQMNIEVSTSLYYHFGCVLLCTPKVPKLRSLHIYNQYLQENVVVEADFLFADKN